MSMFKKSEKKEMPGIASGSLSDIVFMLLFFFMVTTQMRETENKVVVRIPSATESVKLERKDLATYINVGAPIRRLQAQYGNEPRIQLNDSFRNIDDIRDFIAAERDSKKEGERALMTVCIRASIRIIPPEPRFGSRTRRRRRLPSRTVSTPARVKRTPAKRI